MKLAIHDVKAMQTLVTRIDEGSQIIFCGDSAEWQKILKVSLGWCGSII